MPTDETRTSYLKAAEDLQKAVAMVKRLRRASPKSDVLKDAGYLNERGAPYNPNSIKMMLES